jgi:hypothetical protein
MADPSWVSFRGPELLEAFDQGDLTDLLGRHSAIYMWKLALRPSLLAKTDPVALLDFIDRVMRTPYGTVAPRRLSHFVWLDGFRIRGPGLPDEKRRHLRRWAEAKPSNRRWLQLYLLSLSDHAPTLYVGETGSLSSRIGQHLSGETDFGQTVAAFGSLEWSLLDLHYVSVGAETENESSLRKALEYVAAVVTVAGLTTKPG